MYDFDLPDGMTSSDFRDHPVQRLIRDSAHHGARGVPSRAELDALALSDADRAKVAKACLEAAAAFTECGGNRKPVWAAADETAAKIIGELPEDQRSPNYIEDAKPDPTDTMTPEQLAAHVAGGLAETI
jgi:hypothetical protein